MIFRISYKTVEVYFIIITLINTFLPFFRVRVYLMLIGIYSLTMTTELWCDRRWEISYISHVPSYHLSNLSFWIIGFESFVMTLDYYIGKWRWTWVLIYKKNEVIIYCWLDFRIRDFENEKYVFRCIPISCPIYLIHYITSLLMMGT